MNTHIYNVLYIPAAMSPYQPRIVSSHLGYPYQFYHFVIRIFKVGNCWLWEIHWNRYSVILMNDEIGATGGPDVATRRRTFVKIKFPFQCVMLRTPIQLILTGQCVSIWRNYSFLIVGVMASKITSPTIVYSTVYSGADQRTHQCYASLTFCVGNSPVTGEFPHKGPVTRKMSPFDDVIMGRATLSSAHISSCHA